MATTTTGTKVNLFNKAAGKTAAAPAKSKKKETVWNISPLVTDVPSKEQLNSAVSEMHRLNAERKRVETEQEIYKGILKPWAEERYFEHVAKFGVEPESPLKVVNDKHESVTFVVQDRSGQAVVTDEQVAMLGDLLGQDAAAELIVEAGEFKFDVAVMTQTAPDGTSVQEVVSEAISEALAKLVDKGRLSADQVENLLSYQTVRRFRPNLLPYALSAGGRNIQKLQSLFGALGSAIVRYVKA